MYIDLVICELRKTGFKYLFQAAPFSHLEKGDDVIVETKSDDSKVGHSAIVFDSITVDDKSDIFRFIVNAFGAKLPLQKVLKKIRYIDIENKTEKNTEV